MTARQIARAALTPFAFVAGLAVLALAGYAVTGPGGMQMAVPPRHRRPQGPGMLPAVLRIAQAKGVTEEQAWAARDRAGLERLLAAHNERRVQAGDMPAPEGPVNP